MTNKDDWMWDPAEMEQRFAEAKRKQRAKRVFKEPVLYIVTTNELFPVKIGITATPNQRLTSLQIGNWNELFIYKMFSVLGHASSFEVFIHGKLTEHHLRGEWFKLHADKAEERVLEIFEEWKEWRAQHNLSMN